MISLIYKLFTNMYNNNKRFLRFFPYDDQVFNLKVKRKQTQRSTYWLIVFATPYAENHSWFMHFVNDEPPLDDAIVMTVVVSLFCDQTQIFSRISLSYERRCGDLRILPRWKTKKDRIMIIIKNHKKKS